MLHKLPITDSEVHYVVSVFLHYDKGFVVGCGGGGGFCFCFVAVEGQSDGFL